MRTLLLLVLSMVTVAREVTAQDTQCVLERAAMVETIRAYAPRGSVKIPRVWSLETPPPDDRRQRR
ncbi:hypothetical protein ABIF66_005169 [Bradyrhizobium japonicum]